MAPPRPLGRFFPVLKPTGIFFDGTFSVEYRGLEKVD